MPARSHLRQNPKPGTKETANYSASDTVARPKRDAAANA